MQSEEKRGYYAGLLFMIWPLLGVASAFRNYKEAWGKNVLWAFVAFYGFTFAIGVENQGSDIVRYVAEVKSLYGVNMGVSESIKYFLQSGEIDVFKTLIAIVVSRFTDGQAMLTLVYGIIFGFFFSRNMWYVLERVQHRIQPITVLLFICFFLVIPIWSINAFRMWTAAHIFMYGLLPFLFEGKKKGVIISAVSILMHYAFIIPVGVLVLYILLGNRLTAYFIFFMLTFFFSEINLQTFNQYVGNYAPKIIQERSSSYRSEEKVKEYRQGEAAQKKVWYAVWYSTALKWSIMGFLVVLFFKGRDFFREHPRWMSLFSFTLLYYAIANLFSSLPSGGRFVSIANMCALALIILYIQNQEQDIIMKRFVWVATPALLLFVIVAVRVGLYSLSATAILGNPVIAPFLSGENISLNDALKMLL